MIKLEYIDQFDETLYKSAGTTAVRECHVYVDDTNKDISPIEDIKICDE